MRIYQGDFLSPFALIHVYADKNAIIQLRWKGDKSDIRCPAEAEIINQGNALIEETFKQLSDYFTGKRRTFELPLNPAGTPFQKSVWQALMKIPYGETWSYQRLAQAVSKPGGFRAVGNANGRNPIPIIIPCHRVINKNGTIGGYSGGLKVKRWLLKHEGVLPLSIFSE